MSNGAAIMYQWSNVGATSTLTVNNNVLFLSMPLYTGNTSTGSVRVIGAQANQVTPYTQSGQFTFGFGASAAELDRILSETFVIPNSMNIPKTVLSSTFTYNGLGDATSFHFVFADADDPVNANEDLTFNFLPSDRDDFGRPVSGETMGFTYSAIYPCDPQ